MKKPRTIYGSGSSALTPNSSTNEFAASQQEQIAALCARLAGVERRYNGQQKRIASQEAFIATLTAENAEVRKRLRFLENAAKLKAGPR
jgi:hypothetical protein